MPKVKTLSHKYKLIYSKSKGKQIALDRADRHCQAAVRAGDRTPLYNG